MFYELFTEKFVKDWRNEKEHYYMVRGYIPLTPSILKEFEVFIPQSYHATDTRGFESVIKLQGKRVDLPTFTRGSEGLAQGARTWTEFVLELEGYSSFGSDADMVTLLDRNGHRWLSKNSDEKGDGIIKAEFTRNIMKKIAKKYNINESSTPLIIDEIELIVDNMNGKEKSKFIKFYYDESKKIITKSFLNRLKDSFVKAYKSRRDDFTNDEILLHNFKIKSAYRVLEDESIEKFEELKNIKEAMKAGTGMSKSQFLMSKYLHLDEIYKRLTKDDKKWKSKGVEIVDWIGKGSVQYMDINIKDEMPY